MFQFRQITLNLVYFLNLLLVFLLLFEDKVQVPVFLQVTGRMHPLVLHFPLVLLFVGIFLECLLRRKDYQHTATQKITSYVFYLFAVTASITALFGFFLYKEGSYLGEEVTLHKWAGTAVSVLAIPILWLMNRPARAFYYGTLVVSALCVILAGHVGAEVTHGDGFLTEPIRKVEKNIQVENADSAVVFRDVIQPILNEKCLNCHNPNRAKNDLILADYQSLMKGGETRNFIVAGQAEESLLYKYIVLPMNDSLHMPPKEKLQLDQEEIKLIGWWINTGAHADQKYVALPKVDSIQTIMLSKFLPKSGLDLLEIPFANPDEIKQVNNPYRTVQQISATKPYVAVFLGSKKDFSANDLTQLKEVGNQVVSIDMGNSHVKDEDLKHLKAFPHVQKLHLQNIPIGDEGVKHLKDLRFLDVLNLSGTKISAKTLNELSGWEHLKKLYLYNTAVSVDAVTSLKKFRPDLEVYSTQFDLSDTVYNAQLTVPVVKIDSSFFRKSASIEVKLSRGKVKYYYTLDGTEPTPDANLYSEPFRVNESGEFKIKATMNGWADSKVATFPLLKVGTRPDRVTLEAKPDPKYSAKMDSTLVDGKAGSLDREDKQYLGFVNRDPEALFQMNSPKKLSHVTLSFLEDTEKGVFAPEHIEVWGGEDKNTLRKLGSMASALPRDKRPAMKGLMQVNFPPQNVRFLRLKAKSFRTFPAWVQNKKDVKSSVFIDEVSLE
jgi:hypothetical protein